MNSYETMRGTVVLAGGLGFIGRRLHSLLRADGWDVKVLSRRRSVVDGKTIFWWDPASCQIDERFPLTVQAVVNLAGENIAGGRWTRRFKEALYRSRIDSTCFLVSMADHWQAKTFIQVVGVGYYGYDRGDEWLSESAPPGDGFLARLSIDWEAAAQEVMALNRRLVILRTGVVIGADGGIIARLMPLALLNLLSPLGSGNQWMSWIHIDDLATVIQWALNSPHSAGIYNACAPRPVRHKKFIYEFVSSINKAIFLPNVPRWMLRIMLGEMERALTGSLRVDSSRIRQMISLRYPTIEAALNAVSPLKR